MSRSRDSEGCLACRYYSFAVSSCDSHEMFFSRVAVTSPRLTNHRQSKFTSSRFTSFVGQAQNLVTFRVRESLHPVFAFLRCNNIVVMCWVFRCFDIKRRVMVTSNAVKNLVAKDARVGIATRHCVDRSENISNCKYYLGNTY